MVSAPSVKYGQTSPMGSAGITWDWVTLLTFKAEVVDKTKVRVYGRMFNDKLIPATKGIVESKDLKPEELPKVKNPPSA